MAKSQFLDYEKVIAQGCLTNSKHPKCFVNDVYPKILVNGEDATVKDENGKSYIDYICGLGSNLLGYGNQRIASAISDAYKKGSVLSLGTPEEMLLGQKLKEIIPFIDKIKIHKTGSEACSAAVKIARAYNGRKTVLSNGYHGKDDLFCSLNPFPGIADSFDVKEFVSLDQIDSSISCVIVEPIGLEDSDSRREYLSELRNICTINKVVLIFDEVITGFRVPKFTVSNYYNVFPDLICLGKALGGGMPISVVAGKKALMDGEYFSSSTFGGDRVSIAASLKLLEIIRKEKAIDTIWDRGGRFRKKFNELCKGVVEISGYNSRGSFAGDPMSKALFWQECVKAGILFGPSWFYCLAHSYQDHVTFSILSDVLFKIKQGRVELEGDMPQVPLAQKIRSKLNE